MLQGCIELATPVLSVGSAGQSEKAHASCMHARGVRHTPPQREPFQQTLVVNALLRRAAPRAAGQSAVSCSLSRAAAPSAIYVLAPAIYLLYTSPRLQRPRRGRASQHVVVVVVVHGGDVGRRPGAPRATAGLRRHPHPTLHGRGLGRLVVAAVVVVRGVVVPAARRLVVGRRPGWAGWAEGQGRDCNWSSGRGRGRGVGPASGPGLGLG